LFGDLDVALAVARIRAAKNTDFLSHRCAGVWRGGLQGLPNR
jgi:hypothetical protein